ncbi:hypothetical protein MUCCIDRAFT_166338 [Mucor lusitanicus CBS 277.49]|uniref:Uncharacterized protein n=1 Tax=Mucor lusitanicus CBS 277.49 TaxID=747725 RepID=A0A168IZL2_MUCCL|nr:hypothetical protein MUCCIDRAFT_166338 [Mucor lusitanicus CBS 277.49]
MSNKINLNLALEEQLAFGAAFLQTNLQKLKEAHLNLSNDDLAILTGNRIDLSEVLSSLSILTREYEELIAFLHQYIAISKETKEMLRDSLPEVFQAISSSNMREHKL